MVQPIDPNHPRRILNDKNGTRVSGPPGGQKSESPQAGLVSRSIDFRRSVGDINERLPKVDLPHKYLRQGEPPRGWHALLGATPVLEIQMGLLVEGRQVLWGREGVGAEYEENGAAGSIGHRPSTRKGCVRQVSCRVRTARSNAKRYRRGAVQRRNSVYIKHRPEKQKRQGGVTLDSNKPHHHRRQLQQHQHHQQR